MSEEIKETTGIKRIKMKGSTELLFGRMSRCGSWIARSQKPALGHSPAGLTPACEVKRDEGKGLGSDKRDAGGARGEPTDGRGQLASTQEDNAGSLVDLMEGTL